MLIDKRISFIETAVFRLAFWLLSLAIFEAVFYFSAKQGSGLLKIGAPIVGYSLHNRKVVKAPAAPRLEPNSPRASEKWGVAKQIDEVTWTIKVGSDEQMAAPEDIFAALNVYRNRHGSGTLVWDENLADYARRRAAYFNSIKGLDKHKGFIEYTNSEENMRRLGFWGAGENAAYGYRLEGVHIIEWIFAGDEPHDKNQLDPSWTHVGIGVDGSAVAVIFGKIRI